MNNPLISIIIPTYNRVHLIGETLDSILAQTYTNWECIIVDDGSTDDTEKVIRNYLVKDKRFQFYKRTDNYNPGGNGARNYGFTLCKGDYIKWFDSDDVMLPDCLQEQVKSIKGFDVAVCEVQKFDFENQKILGISQIISNQLVMDYFVGKVTFFISGPLWNADFIRKQNELFDEEISNLDDWDFNLRMLYKNPKIKFIKQPLIKYRIHNASLSKELDKLNLEEIYSELKARDKHIKLLNSNDMLKPDLLQTFIIIRLKYFLRDALVTKSSSKTILFKEFIKRSIGLRNWAELCKVILGYYCYYFFNKGYKLLS